jgi:hypothetical protein
MYDDNSTADGKRLFIGLLTLLLTAVLFVTGTFVSMMIRQERLFATVSVVILLVIAAVFALFILITLISIIMVYSGRGNVARTGRIAKRSLNIIFSTVLGFGKLIGLDRERIQRAYASINNRVVYSSRPDLLPEDILILLPHCIQSSKCKHRITGDIYNCAGCGRCSVSDLVRLGKRLGIKIRMVPGGTLARKTVAEVKPKAIVAVACERDLCSGMRDISSLPVIGIPNERPWGPCRDTKVDVKKVEDAIEFLCNRRCD